jgi:hypothetical protein
MYKEQPLDTACSVGKGICKRTGTYICNDAQTGTVCSVKAGQKKTEICDGKDNDCNGQIDEPWPNKGKDCDNGQQGGCRKTGKWVCKNDNQGIRCTAPSVTQGPEVCDGKDNDCNGKIDENWSNDLGKSCDNGSKGECFKAGKIVCDSTGNGTICDAPNNVTGTAEVCNGKDDDCDGQTDEDISEVGQQCKVPNQQDSNCEQGKWACESNQLTCKTTAQTQSESCNGDDDDCNGKIDDIAPKECWKNGKRGKKYCRQGDWSDCKR